jgi:hypothetical protein
MEQTPETESRLSPAGSRTTLSARYGPLLALPHDRRQLPIANKPIFVTVRSRVWLGYRRNRLSNGSWVLRVADGKRSSWSVKIGEADDYSKADDHRVLDFLRAKQRAADLADLGDQQQVRTHLKNKILRTPHHGRAPKAMTSVEAVLALGNTAVEELARLFACRLVDAMQIKISCLAAAARALYEPLSPPANASTAPPPFPILPGPSRDESDAGPAAAAPSDTVEVEEDAARFWLSVGVKGSSSMTSIDRRLHETLRRMVHKRRQLPAEITRSALIEYLAAE